MKQDGCDTMSRKLGYKNQGHDRMINVMPQIRCLNEKCKRIKKATGPATEGKL